MTYSNGDIEFQMEGAYQDNNTLSNITIAGLTSPPSHITINGKNLQYASTFSNKGVLSLTGLQNQTAGGVFNRK